MVVIAVVVIVSCGLVLPISMESGSFAPIGGSWWQQLIDTATSTGTLYCSVRSSSSGNAEGTIKVSQGSITGKVSIKLGRTITRLSLDQVIALSSAGGSLGVTIKLGVSC